MTHPIVVLGPQRPKPNLPAALERAGVQGPVALITAGWRHEENETEALVRAVRRETLHLPLYGWFEELNAANPDLARHYRDKTTRVRAWKRAYRARLEGSLGALIEVQRLAAERPELYAASVQAGLADLRRLDDEVSPALDAIRAGEPVWSTAPVRAYHDRVARALERADAVALAGGQVATLLNRLRFFGVGGLLRAFQQRGGRIFAWSAGAMVLTERVFLFYDHPPQGSGHPEVLDAGLGLLQGVTLFPWARQRLDLDDRDRLWRLLERLGGRRAIGLANGDALELHQGAVRVVEGAPFELGELR